MSYCRIGKYSDVYVVRSESCFEITLRGEDGVRRWERKDLEETRQLLIIIRQAGYMVSEVAIQRIAEEILTGIK